MGERCLHSKGNFTLQRIDCVSVLTVKDKGYLKYIFPFIVSNPRSPYWSCIISAVYMYIFWKAYWSALVRNLQN